jgi:pimeloyl-ACP methyl ester carboxylesterase
MTMPPETPAPKIQEYIDLDGLRTYYEIHGTGEPLVLLHGGFCPVETFDGLTPLLAEHYRVYLPERRAHGRTSDIEGPITYEAMAQDTIAFLEAVGLASADFVGWSDGAVVALLVSLRRPGLVRRLVMIGQGVNPEGLQPEYRAMTQQETMPEMLPEMLEQLYAAVSPDGPEHWAVVKDKLWQLYRTEPNLALSELGRVSAPTLLIIAEHDFPTVEHAQAMQQALPDARLQVVPDTTHALPIEQPVVVSRLVLDFLATPEGSSADA